MSDTLKYIIYGAILVAIGYLIYKWMEDDKMPTNRSQFRQMFKSPPCDCCPDGGLNRQVGCSNGCNGSVICEPSTPKLGSAF